MTNEELLAKINDVGHSVEYGHGIDTSRIVKQLSALRAVVELHKPFDFTMGGEPYLGCNCGQEYPCPTIQVIEDKLN